MRNFTTVSLSLALLSGFVSIGHTAEVGDPSVVRMKMYATYISPNSDCSNAREIFREASPSYQDMANGTPTFGRGIVGNGTYPCIIIELSDRIESVAGFTSDSGNCIQGQTKVLDIARGEVTTHPTTGVHTTTAVGEDRIFIYLTTAPSGSVANNSYFQPSQPGPLANAFVVRGDRSGLFVMDFTGKISDQEAAWDSSHVQAPTMDNCELDAPVFRFR